MGESESGIVKQRGWPTLLLLRATGFEKKTGTEMGWRDWVDCELD